MTKYDGQSSHFRRILNPKDAGDYAFGNELEVNILLHVLHFENVQLNFKRNVKTRISLLLRHRSVSLEESFGHLGILDVLESARQKSGSKYPRYIPSR